MDPNTQAPDMQSATGVPAPPEPMNQGGLIDALRSRGTLPQNLAQSMNQAGPGPSIGLAMGSGALNAGSGGNAALNPYLQQYQAQQNAQVQQAMEFEKLQDQKLLRANQQNELAWKMTQGMVDSDDAEARKQGWQNRARLAGPLGVKINSTIVEGLSRGKLNKEQMQRVVGMVDDGQLPEDIGRVTGLSPDLVQQGMQIAQSDSSRRVLGILTKSEAEAGKAKDQQAQLELARNEYGLTDPKDPRIPFAFSYTQREFGKPFDKATREERNEAIEKSQSVAPAAKNDNPATVKVALAEAGLPPSTTDVKQIEQAMNQYRGRQQRERMDLAAVNGQLTQVGKQYGAELGRVNQNLDQLKTLDSLVNDMDRLVLEGRKLGLTNNPQAVNAVQQELAHWTGGPVSKAAQWYRAWDTLDARFATVAQAIEKITGNRLAQQNAMRALGFHPKRTDPYGVQLRVIGELKQAAAASREAAHEDLSRTLRQYQGAAGALGVPFILGGAQGGGHEVESVEEDK